MKNSLVLCVLSLAILQSCGNDSVPTCEDCNFNCVDANALNVISNDCFDNWECNFTVSSQSSVDITTTFGLAQGDKNVFQMNNSTEGDLAIADDEFTNILVFELDPSQTSFAAEDDELQNLNMHYREFCFCPDTQFKEIVQGCIQGERQVDGSWFVQASFIVPDDLSDIEINLDAHFVN